MPIAAPKLYRCKRCKKRFATLEPDPPVVLSCPWCNPPVPGAARQENVIRKVGANIAERLWDWWKMLPPPPDDDET